MARCAIVNSAITLWLTLCHLLAACAIMARRNKIRLMPSQHSTTEFSIMIKLAHFLNILRTASFMWTSLVVTNCFFLKLNGVNGKGDEKFHICKCAVDVHEEHNKVARGGGPKTFIRAIWGRITCCGQSNARVGCFLRRWVRTLSNLWLLRNVTLTISSSECDYFVVFCPLFLTKTICFGMSAKRTFHRCIGALFGPLFWMFSLHSTTKFSKLAPFLNILRTASFKWTSLVTNSFFLKLNGVNGKGDAKFHICKCAVDVHEEHNKVARGGGPKTFIRAIWRRASGHSNAGVVWAMFILFLPCAASAPVVSGEYAKPCAASAPVDSAEFAKQLEIAEAKISYAFSWQAYVIFSASIIAIGAVVLASCVLCVSIGCYGWMIAKDIAKIRENRDERKAMCAQHQVVLGSTRKE